ncbi:MAG: RpiB/LacA/LacB family sugar-phosphate isomerase [Bacilli bacterium]|jgi:ribose 5-phosphate isomerase B|nr:RpiB/LacA/LacB family sugar-phosphate isomerase [Bacilli bacterium]
MVKIAIGCDHGGVELKKYLLDNLLKEGYEVTDCGTYTTDSVNYPYYAFAVANKVASGEVNYGVVICRSGEGVSIAANKVKGIRCGIGYNEEVSHLMKEHNDANMIAFGADFITKEDALRNLHTFLAATFLQGHHQIRVDMIKDYENEHSKD